MVIHQLPPYSEVVQFGDGHGNMMSPCFFWQLWRLGFPPPQLLPNGNVACVVATCHAGIGWGVFGSTETFQFSHVFWGASFLNPLCSFSMLFYFLFFQNFAFLYALLLWFLCSSPWFLSFTFFFRYTPLFFLFFFFFWSFICFIFLCFVAFLNFAFFFLFPFWWTILILGALPPQLPSFSLVWVCL